MTVGPARLESRIATGYRQYRETYLVTSNILGEDPNNVLNATGIPARYAPYTSDPGSYAQRPSAVIARGNVASANLWRVTVNYSQYPDRMVDQEQPDPVSTPIEWAIGGMTVREPFDREVVSNYAVVNTANDPIADPPPDRDESRPDISFVKIFPPEAWTDGTTDTWEDYADSLNNATVWGRPARTLKMLPVTANSVYYDKAEPYMSATFRFNVKIGNLAPANCFTTGGIPVALDEELGWQAAYQSNGFRQLVNGTPERIADIVTPALLDSAGAVTDDETMVAYRFVQRYPEKNYAALNLPTALGAPS